MPGGIQIAGKTPNDGSYEQHISHMQKKINDTIAKNKELYEISPPVSKLNLHCEYISYCLGVSIVLGYHTLDMKDFFPPFRYAPLITQSSASLCVYAQIPSF